MEGVSRIDRKRMGMCFLSPTRAARRNETLDSLFPNMRQEEDHKLCFM